MEHSNTQKFLCLVKECNKIFDNYFNYSRHLTSYHGLPINIMYLKFNNKADFKKWMHHEEYLNKCFFIPDATNDSVYKCHRSDFILNSIKEDDLFSRQDEEERLFKVRSPCPVNIKYEIKNEECHIIYTRTHYGTCLDLKPIALSTETQNMVQDLLRKGLDERAIVEKIRNTIKDKSSTDYLITPKHVDDLKNDSTSK